MRAARHALGRWLLRDAPKPEVKFKIDAFDPGSVAAIHKMLLKYKRERGGGSLGLS